MCVFLCAHAWDSPKLKAKHDGNVLGGNIWIVLGRIMSDRPPGFWQKHTQTQRTVILSLNSPLAHPPPSFSVNPSGSQADFTASRLVCVCCWRISSGSRKISEHVREKGKAGRKWGSVISGNRWAVWQRSFKERWWCKSRKEAKKRSMEKE